MLSTLLLAIVAAAQAAPPAPITRSVTISVYTKKSEVIGDLKAEEVGVTEGGRKRTVLGIEPDGLPLEVAVVVDSSVMVASAYRSDLVSAIVAFWRALPPGSRLAVWTSGPASRVVSFGTEIAAGEAALQSVAPGGKNYAVDALLDASRGFGGGAAARRVVVYIGGTTIEASQSRAAEMTQALGQAGATPMIVLIEAGALASSVASGPTGGVSFSVDVQGFFERVADGYRGTCKVVLSTQAARKALLEAAADLASQYRVRYESTTGDPTPLEVEVSRKGAKVRLGRTRVEALKPD